MKQQNNEPIPHEEKFGYFNPMEYDHWSDVATRIVIKAAAVSAFFFSIVWACNRF